MSQLLDLLGPEPLPTVHELPAAHDYQDFFPFIRGVFSQWHATPFRLFERDFVTAEQWMMYAKALLFADQAAASAILATDDPGEQKRLGQGVRDFHSETWDRWKVAIVYRGSLEKFRQNPGAAKKLAQTAPAMLVEANPRDWIWGCGLSESDPKVQTPAEWKGENLLGRILTLVRNELERT